MEKRVKILEDDNNPVWRSKIKGNIKISDMDDSYLQSAKLYVQTRQLHFHNKMLILTRLEESLDNEAKKRNLSLKDLDGVRPIGNFFKQRRKITQSTVQTKQKK